MAAIFWQKLQCEDKRKAWGFRVTVFGLSLGYKVQFSFLFYGGGAIFVQWYLKR